MILSVVTGKYVAGCTGCMQHNNDGQINSFHHNLVCYDVIGATKRLFSGLSCKTLKHVAKYVIRQRIVFAGFIISFVNFKHISDNCFDVETIEISSSCLFEYCRGYACIAYIPKMR